MMAEPGPAQGPRAFTSVGDRAAALPETAQRILSAASKLLEERGFQALTLENIAAEAGVNKASVRYHFGNKAGLLAAVVDEIVDGEMLQLTAKLRDVADEDRLHAAMVGIQGMITATDCFKGFFDILPYAFRDDEFRTRLVALYPWWYQQNLEWLGLVAESADGPQGEILQGIAELIAAIVDGLSIQAGLDPEHFDLQRPLAALELLLRNSMEQFDQMAARPGSSSA